MQVDVGASVKATNTIFDQGSGGQHHHRHQAAAGTERFADRVAAHAGQHQIEEDQIDLGVSLLEHGEGLVTVGDGRDGEPFGSQVVPDADGEMVLVFDEQDVGHDAERVYRSGWLPA